MMSHTTLRPAPPKAPSILVIDDPHGLNHETDEAYPEALYLAVPAGPNPAVAVDLGTVDLLTSRGVRVLVNLKRKVERARGRLVLFRLSAGVRHQLQVTRLARHFPSVSDRKSALEVLRSASPL